MWGCLWRSVRTLRLDQLTLTLLLLLLWWTPNVHRLICSSRQAQQWTYYHPATWWDVAATLQCCCWAVSWLWIVDQTHQQNLIWGKQVCYTTAVPSDRKKKKKNPANKKRSWWKWASQRERGSTTLQGPRYPARSFQDFYWSSAHAHSSISPFMLLLCWWICCSTTRIYNGLCRRAKVLCLGQIFQTIKTTLRSVCWHFKAGTSDVSKLTKRSICAVAELWNVDSMDSLFLSFVISPSSSSSNNNSNNNKCDVFT